MLYGGQVEAVHVQGLFACGLDRENFLIERVGTVLHVTQLLYQRCREELYLLFCSVLEFGPVPTTPTPCYEALRFALLHPIRRPKSNDSVPLSCLSLDFESDECVPFAGGAVHIPVDGVRTRARARRQDTHNSQRHPSR